MSGGRCVLRAAALSHGFGARRILGPCSFELRDAEVVALVGPSGVGKTTLLRILAGLIRPDGGTVTLSGHGGQGIAMVFQDYALFPWRNAQRNVEYPLQIGGIGRAARRELARAALAQVGLAASADLYPAQLSGGMRQRVALARAIVTRPAVMLLDEPLAALDQATRRQLQDHLSGLFAQLGCAVVLVTHDLHEAVRLADRVLVLGGSSATVVADLYLESGNSAAQVMLLQKLMAQHAGREGAGPACAPGASLTA